ncbi:class I SAM-dependent methyltransferase [Bosea sp. AAP35]|uniref:class I SAM-dependent methyltransferase n=1 Tax=Bosea sp. AAP35 TaxID=1523417 RepID=UPI0018D0E010|nr:class I SAM-dependent methyltransferase [Bosea sp. AAP35]
MTSSIQTAAAYWNERSLTPLPPRVRWWQSPIVVRHINRLLTGTPALGAHTGFHELIQRKRPGSVFRKAVSVGCGTGVKEAGLVAAGIVAEFHLYEISAERIRQGRQQAEAKGLANRMLFHEADAFAQCLDVDFDLVYWNNSLHHMPDVNLALDWSRGRLQEGGLFAMDDFVGPSRFQWSERSLRYATDFRNALPPEYLRHPTDPQRALSREVRRPSVEKLMAIDPSEAADSDRILAALQRVFPEAETCMTGGVIYHLGLNDVLANIDEDKEASLLHTALLLDKALAEQGETHYAVALATV